VKGLALVLAIAGSTAASGASADQELFSCLHGTPPDYAAFEKCTLAFSGRCWETGDDITDYAPQTACFLEVVDHVREIHAALTQDADGGLKAGIQAAALRRDMRIGDARCDFRSETNSMRKDTASDADALYDADCRALYYAGAYWRVVVHERTK